ncbi:porin [Chelativorans sp. M5D2P16]|uniref:porin n=1 Tax=Chelativorans sp. M5D2P16 TaxID=3095678 RepID=UPI002ACAC82C|nr:porin [Chelativorans sp. M5D2P16]MDZ5696232.1 porin [Chelativorans sp. M5D2P16]
MKIKSLLIGSAAATVAATGAAQAADAIFVPEPEPMEYVRVCDVYGAGFFYIPGTETCLRISGMVRYQIGFSDGDLGDNDGWRKYARAEVNFDARSETEYGTLGAYIRFRGQSSPGAGDPRFTADGDSLFGLNEGGAYSRSMNSFARLQHAIISLGGLSMGVKDSIWDTGLSGEQDVGFFPYDRVHFMQYDFAGANGFNASIVLEEADDDYDYTPNVVGKVGVTQGWGSFDLYGAYDATAEEFAVKGILQANLTERLFAGLMGQYESGISYYSVNPFDGIASTGLPFHLGAEWSAAAEIGYHFTPKLSASLGGSYYSELGHGIAATDVDAYNIGTTIDYEIVQDFNAKLSVNYASFDTPTGDFDQWHGFLRFQRNF